MRCLRSFALVAASVAHSLAPSNNQLQGLRAAVVGGGASGLLLAHRLLDAGATVRIFEGRADPRGSDALEGRAYALGLGLRGRTAIRSCDDELWQSVKGAGFGSDRFTIHLPVGAIDLRKPDPAREPSVLIYQTALCGALLDELERRHASDRLRMSFERKVEDVDPLTGAVDGAGERVDVVHFAFKNHAQAVRRVAQLQLVEQRAAERRLVDEDRRLSRWVGLPQIDSAEGQVDREPVAAEARALDALPEPLVAGPDGGATS